MGMADTWGITLTAASFSQGKKRLILDAIKYEGAGEWVRRLEQNSVRNIFIIEEKKVENVSCA